MIKIYKVQCQFCGEIVDRVNCTVPATCFNCKKIKAKERVLLKKRENLKPLYKCITCNDKAWNTVWNIGGQCGFCQSLKIKTNL